jgi:hypothetical protein
MAEAWVVEELETADLGDKRLNDRFVQVLDGLAKHPTASIPSACNGYAETAGAYRFFQNEKATFDSVIEAHRKQTRIRMAAQPVAIVAQDTTEIDLTRPEQQVVGAGPLDGGARFGALLHELHAFTPDGTPLGTVDAFPWIRDDEPTAPRSEREKEKDRKKTPIEEKESWRWVETLNKCREVSRAMPNTQIVAVADSEADIYELFAAAQAEPQEIDWIVRACQNRALIRDEHQGESPQRWLRERLQARPVLFTKTISIRGRKPKVNCEKRTRRQARQSRKAEVEVRAAAVTLRPPWREDRKLPPVTLNAVLVREINPPKGEEPVEWILLTSLPIDDVEQVQRVVQYYCVRWMIEVFFRTLKSGCRVEERLFEHIDRLLPCLAAYLIVAWRTLYVCRLGRSCPDTSCEAVFEPAEWKAVYHVVRRKPPPSNPPPLSEMVRMVAQLGGYVNRKRPDPPGAQTIWLGLQRAHDFTECWLLFGPGAASSGGDV